MTLVERFHRLSVALTGVTPLDVALAGEYLPSVQAVPNFAALVDEFDACVAAGGDVDARIRTRIMAVPALLAAAQAVILLWYLGEVRGATTAEHYFRGVFWEVIGAHTPGLSGGYFGHWSYPPDN
jgi:hypothetical protein